MDMVNVQTTTCFDSQNRAPKTIRARFELVIFMLLVLGSFVGSARAQDLDNETVFHVDETQPQNLVMNGTINDATPRQLNEMLKANPQIRTIVLQNCPGADADDDTFFPMVYNIRKRGLNTHLNSDSDISSGAVDFFLAGTVRTMDRGAKIGVHAWYDDDDRMEATQYPKDSPAHRTWADYSKAMLGSEDFYWFTISAADSDGMHHMSESEISQYGLVTGY